MEKMIFLTITGLIVPLICVYTIKYVSGQDNLIDAFLDGPNFEKAKVSKRFAKIYTIIFLGLLIYSYYVAFKVVLD